MAITSLPAELGTYVYGLEDPRTGELFYVGRGIGDRCQQHARDALANPEPSDKLERIRIIHAECGVDPRIVVLRHGLPGSATPAQVAAEVEAAVIDVLLRWKLPLTNVVRGAGIERGLRTLDSLRAELDPRPLHLDRPAILVNIGRLWSDGMSEREVWETAREWWLARPERRVPRPELLLAEAAKIVRGVWLLPWDREPENVVRHRLVEWDEVTPERQALWGDRSAFTPGPYCQFLAGEGNADTAALVGTHTGALPRSYGAAFRYVP